MQGPPQQAGSSSLLISNTLTNLGSGIPIAASVCFCLVPLRARANGSWGKTLSCHRSPPRLSTVERQSCVAPVQNRVILVSAGGWRCQPPGSSSPHYRWLTGHRSPPTMASTIRVSVEDFKNYASRGPPSLTQVRCRPAHLHSPTP